MLKDWALLGTVLALLSIATLVGQWLKRANFVWARRAIDHIVQQPRAIVVVF